MSVITSGIETEFQKTVSMRQIVCYPFDLDARGCISIAPVQDQACGLRDQG
jgi:hypothetical protein